jgi:hypothetical protein
MARTLGTLGSAAVMIILRRGRGGSGVFASVLSDVRIYFAGFVANRKAYFVAIFSAVGAVRYLLWSPDRVGI